MAVRGLGREQPTLFLCNNVEIRPRMMVTDYARRNGIEGALGSSVNFFHLDCLASEVRLNADLDTVLTVVAHGCYRWLANQLHGFDQAKPKRLYRKFVEVPGTFELTDRREIVVHFQRRAHNPILRERSGTRMSADPVIGEPSPPIDVHYSERYERIERGEFDVLRNLERLGELLIAVRTSLDLTQAELAGRLGVDPSVVCRDERSEYHGVTLERAARILNVMGVGLRTSVEVLGYGPATLSRETPGGHRPQAQTEPALAGRTG